MAGVPLRHLQIKLAPAQRAEFVASARRQGVTISEFLRKAGDDLAIAQSLVAAFEWLREAGDLAVARGSTR